MTDLDQPDPIEASLAEFRERFANRRTVPYEMFQFAERLVRASTEYHARQARDAAAAADERAQVVIDAANAEHARLLEQVRRLEADAAEWRTRYQDYKRDQTNLRESRETIDDGTLVKINAPRISSWGDKTIPRPWTLEELEMLTHRMRMAGGDDQLEVRFKHEHVEATVPIPEFAFELARNDARPGGVTPDVTGDRWRPAPFTTALGILVVIFIVGTMASRWL